MSAVIPPNQPPIIVQPPGQSNFDKIFKVVCAALVVGGMAWIGSMRQSGKISDADADATLQTIKNAMPLLLAEKAEDQKQVDKATAVLATKAPHKLAPPPEDPKLVEMRQQIADLKAAQERPRAENPTAFDPSQIIAMIQQGLQLWNQFKPIIDQILPIINPHPTPTPQPTPFPNPQPLPPGPSDIKVLIADSAGKAMTATNVDAGVMFQAILPGAYSKWQWQISPHGDVRWLAMPANSGYAVTLQSGAYVEFFLTVDDGTGFKSASVRVSCNNAPNPPNVIPDNGQTDNTTKPRKLFVAIVEDADNRAPDTAIVMSAMGFWNGLRDKGNEWRFYDLKTSETKGKAAVSAAGAISPALVVRDLTTGELLTVKPLPKTTAAISAILSQWGV